MAPAAVFVNELGDQLLPCSCFAGNQDAGVRRSDAPNVLSKLTHGGAVTHKGTGCVRKTLVFLRRDGGGGAFFDFADRLRPLWSGPRMPQITIVTALAHVD